MRHATTRATVVPLIVEDSASDLALAEHALDGAGVPLGRAGRPRRRAGDGAPPRHRPPARPDPAGPQPARKSGTEVLAELAADPELRRIPVAVLSSPAARKDVAGAYDRNANAYPVKPLDLDEFTAAVQTPRRSWLDVATCRPCDSPPDPDGFRPLPDAGPVGSLQKQLAYESDGQPA